MSWLKLREKVWYIYWSEAGKKHCRAISEDKGVAKNFKIKFDHDRLMQGLRLPNETRMWSDLKQKFLESFSERDKENKKSTYLKYHYAFKLYEKLASPKKLTSITYEKALDFKNKLQNAQWFTQKKKEPRPYSTTSINMVLRNLHAVFNLAVDLEWIPKNPFKKIEQIDTGKKIPKNMTQEDVLKVFDQALKAESYYAYPMAVTYYYTGIRLETLCILKKTMLDLDSGKLYLRGTPEWKAKNGNDHYIPLHPALVKVLRTLPQTDSEYVFPGKTGGKRDKWSVGRLFNKLYKRAGLDFSGVHRFRHTFITDLMRDNQPHIVKDIASHGNISTTLGYTHIRDEERKKAVEKLKDLTVSVTNG